MYFGSSTSPEMSVRLLDQYVEAGGSFLDSANMYARWVEGCVGGESETLLGEWMRERKNRGRMFIATKVGFHYPGVEQGLRAEQIETECEKSLKRLGVETIDLYYAHRDDRDTPVEETMEAFDRLVKAGKVRLIGASNFTAWRLEEALWRSRSRGWAEYCCIQQRYSYARPKSGASFYPQIAANDELMDYCRTRSIRMLAYGPLLGGVYTRADKSLRDEYLCPDTDARLAVLRAVAGELGATCNQVVYAWMMQNEPSVIPLVAASTVEQMHENLASLKLRLSPEQIDRLNSAGA
jgi:aryl-alcohol dehydrogenase-like predicted oxidoreductase